MNKAHHGLLISKMKKQLILALLLAGATAPLLRAQDYPKLAPKTPATEGRVPALPDHTPGKTQGDEGKILLPELHGLVFLSDASLLKAEGLSASGIHAEGLPLFQSADFSRALSYYLGKPLSLGDLNRLTKEIVALYRRNNRPVVDVLVPEQNISSGTVQILVIEGRAGKISAEGNRYFSSELLVSKIRLKGGQPIEADSLLEDVAALNDNPFRQVDLVFSRGQTAGTSDIILRTQDRRPWRFYAGYEDSGNSVTGYDRLIAGANWGNVFGTDHLLNYQLTASPDFSQMVAHSGSYVVPLPGRRQLTVFGSYAKSKPDLHSSLFKLDGSSWQTGVRVRQPLPSSPSRRFSQDLSVGFDFKRSDNDLDFGGLKVFAHSTDVVQAVAAYDASLGDSLGSTGLNLTLAASPGGLSSGNHDGRFSEARAYASSNYVYGRLSLERRFVLPVGFLWVSRGTAQLSDANLLGSEQLGFGGYDTLRGYEEREANGDKGWLVSNELHAPMWRFSAKLGSQALPSRLNSFAFWDYGQAGTHTLLAGEDPHITMSSVGIGLRFSLSTYLQLRADYGWQLQDSGVSSSKRNSRGHLGVTMAY